MHHIPLPERMTSPERRNGMCRGRRGVQAERRTSDLSRFFFLCHRAGEGSKLRGVRDFPSREIVALSSEDVLKARLKHYAEAGKHSEAFRLP